MKSLAARFFACALGLLAGVSLVPLSSTGAEFGQRLINLSTRARVGAGDANAVIAGFVVGEGPPKRILIRASGPSLTQHPINLPTSWVLANPRIELYNSDEVKILENDNWRVTSGGLPVTAADFSAVGAFPFSSDNDSALLVTLPSGAYTVKVVGTDAGTGMVLVEVYDVSGSAKLVNLSTRAEVRSGADIVIAGLVIAPDTGMRKVLVRAVGPTLSKFHVADPLPNPSLTVVDSNGTPVAINDNWGDGDRSQTLATAYASAGAFAIENTGSLDAAAIVDLDPGAYTILVSGVGGTWGVALVEAYDITPASMPIVNAFATNPTTDTAGGAPGVFTITRTGSTAQPIDVPFTLTGPAVPGVDFVDVSRVATIPAGASSVLVEIVPYATTQSTATDKSTTLTLLTGLSYGVGNDPSASVAIAGKSGTLFVSSLRPTPAAVNSVAYGSSSLQLSSDETFALVSLDFSALSSPQTVAYLRLGKIGESGALQLFRIPNGQATEVRWSIRDVGDLAASEITKALKEGRVFVNIESVDFPSGELAGAFVKSSGSMAFTPPPAPPALSLVSPTPPEASRFLTQATFGATQAAIDEVVAMGYQAWITSQMNKPASSHHAGIMADFAANNAGGQDLDSATNLNRRPGRAHRLSTWWKIAVQGDDQLRQRVAFALSEIFVISDENGIVNNAQEGAAYYYDILARNAFGSFRQLLQDVTLSPMMGTYLTYLRNRKATGSVLPDENYAREVMQLFTIGLVQLNPDGTLRLNVQGLPIPTYEQLTISETAKVFTGWGLAQSYSNNPSIGGGGGRRPDNSRPDWIEPMRLFPAFHEDGPKTIVGGQVLPAGQGGLKDLNDTLDALFNHPNVGPFLSRQLIQRLVTSNPSPAYIYRVAQAFADNGAGVRGDLGAVVRAILTDYEARSPEAAGIATFGKLKEPLLRTTALFRALGGTTNTGRYQITNSNAQVSQQALSSPTVFNFFEPNYVHPGPLAAAGLYAPEFMILTGTTAITTANYLYGYLYANRPASLTNSTTVYMDLTNLLPLAATPAALVEKLDLWLTGAASGEATRTRIVSALTDMPASTSSTEKVRSAAYLLIATPEGAIQP